MKSRVPPPQATSLLTDMDAILNASTGLGLRQQAEAILQEKAVPSVEQLKTLSLEALGELFHELHVHQIELELQNNELRQTQLELNTAKARYFDLYDLAPVGYLTICKNGLISQANLAAATLLGLPRRKLINKRLSSFIVNDDLDHYYSFRNQIFESHEPQALSLRMLNNDGIQFWAHLEASAAQDDEGVPSLRITLTNITELIKTEIALHENVDRVQSLVDSALDGVISIDQYGRITNWNPQAAHIFGYSSTQALGSDIAELIIPPAYREAHRQGRARFIKTGVSTIINTRIEVMGMRADGSEFPLELSISAVEQREGYFFNAYVRDITERKLYERSLNQLQVMTDMAMDGFWVVDLTGNLLQANQAYANISGYSVDELVGMHINQLESLEKIERIETRIVKIIQQGHDKFETRHQHKDGHDIDMEISVTFLSEFQRFYVFCRDITERKQAADMQRIAATVFEAQEGILITDSNNAILRVNQAFSNITGYTEQELVGKNPNILSSGRQGANFYAVMWKSLNETGLWDGEIWNRRKNGDIYPEHLTISSVKDPNGIVTNYVATLTDITMSQAAADKIKYLAFYDPLTGLPNRLLLRDRLILALASSQRNDHYGALLFIDLDNFKNLNDTLGHDMGDLLLQQVAERLAVCVREGDTVARLGGDEFVVMLEDLSKSIDEAVVQVEVVGNKILAAFSLNYQLDTHYFHCTPSIGITLFKGQKQSVDELLKQSDIAMYSAKASGRNTLRFFDQHMQDSITNRVALEMDLALALAKNQFTLYYQPQVQHNQHIIGAEALIRWHHPQRGLVNPVDFIPLSEETGLVLPIGQWVLETACAQIKRWEADEPTRHLKISVNVSARQFHQSDFVEKVRLALQCSATNPNNLNLELTETVVLDDIDDTIDKMNALHKLGVSFSMDDFGTGYSSLSYLSRLPLDQLKIDKSFVFNIGVQSSDAVIVQTIIGMAKNLDMEVIAEGVETEQQRNFLELNGCNYYQGYLFSKPVPIEAFEALLKKG